MRMDSNDLQSYSSSLSSSYESDEEIAWAQCEDMQPYLCLSLTGDIEASTNDRIQGGVDMRYVQNTNW